MLLLPALPRNLAALQLLSIHYLPHSALQVVADIAQVVLALQLAYPVLLSVSIINYL